MKTMSAACAALVMLAACGGGSLSGASGSSLAASAQSVASSGTITAFGSVFVNGVRYDVAAATIRKNGRSVAQAALAVGEVALVRGHQDLESGQGSAVSVEVEDNVVGPIATLDSAANTLTVLGQTVNVTASTSFAKDIIPADLSGLKVDDVVEVSGLADATGAIVATRIGRAEAGEPLQVLGKVAGADAGAHTFLINGLTVDFGAATLGGFGAGQPANDDTVVARGSHFDATTMILTADSVQRAGTDPRDDAADARVELEGLVTRFASATDFEVGGAPVTTTDATRFKDGSAADLALNARVEVRGKLDAGGVLVADVVEVGHIAALELQGNVTASNGTDSLTVLGVRIAVDANTRFEDKSAAHLQMFTLKDIAVGDTVQLRGFESPAGSGQIQAQRLERLAPGTEVEVRGPFMATTPPQFTILGITIDASNASFGQVEEQHDLSAGDFYTQAVGQIVAVRGTAAGNVVTASEVRIDSEEDR